MALMTGSRYNYTFPASAPCFCTCLVLRLASVTAAQEPCEGLDDSAQVLSLLISSARVLSLHLPTPRCTQVVCDLIEEEAELVGGSEHVMLAGFSQGGALALHIAVRSGIQ
jgi:hypothetical protein